MASCPHFTSLQVISQLLMHNASFNSQAIKSTEWYSGAVQEVQMPGHCKQNGFPVQKGRCEEVHIPIWNILHFQKILELNMPIEHFT